MSYRAYLLDLWLFMRKVAPSATAILGTLVGSALLFDAASAWPEASLLECFINAFYMMTVEAVQPPQEWYLKIFVLILPTLGVLFAAQGLVSATVLFLNKSQRQGEWNAVVAATCSVHTVVCGLGQLGNTLCNGLLDAGKQVVAVELDEDLAPVVTARRRGAAVIIGDMTLTETLAEANVKQARCVVMCSGDDLANIEAAITAKELSPEVEVYIRVFKKSLADRIAEALRYDIITFSPYATAAETILGQMNSRAEGAGASHSDPPQPTARTEHGDTS